MNSWRVLQIFLAALALLLFLLYVLTAVTAEYAAYRDIERFGERASDLAATCFEGRLDEDLNGKYPRFWDAVSKQDLIADASPSIDSPLLHPHRDRSFSATAIYDADGTCLARSWDDFFFFEYLTEEEWAARAERSHRTACVRFDRQKLTDAVKNLRNIHFDAQAMRFTGCFDGVELIPSKIEFVDAETFDEALSKQFSTEYTVSGVTQDFHLPWTVAYEDPDLLLPESHRVTLYSDWFDVCFAEPSPAFSYRGEKYDTLSALVEEVGPTFTTTQDLNQYKGSDLLLLSVNYCETLNGKTYYTSYHSDISPDEKNAPQLQFYTVSAVYCSPWRTAVWELREVYLITLGLAVLLGALCYSLFKRRHP